MCGIAGVWNDDRTSGPGVKELVAGMLASLAHRGPDAEGMVAGDRGVLGHRRLSIVDLIGGDQPFVQQGAALVANGEIYNAPALRADLETRRSFLTRSDNEVILHAVGETGPPAVTRLRGMFAFALTADGELLLGRDPLGIKPSTAAPPTTAMSCSPASYAPSAGGHRRPARGPRNGLVQPARLHPLRRHPRSEPVPGDLPSHAGRIRHALEQSVTHHLLSDVPVGAFLSGGLDSSAIVAVMRRQVNELHTFSVGLACSPDLAAARAVAEHLGTIHHEYVLDPDEIIEHLPAIVSTLESFDQDLVRSAVPTYFTARLAAEHVKVVMTGEGADELFAGYEYHKGLTSDADVHADARRSLAQLHHVNLQRVDRLTMAHSLEARVPFLDLEFIDAALSVPVALRRPGVGAPEKAVLRLAVQDLLPAKIVWRRQGPVRPGQRHRRPTPPPVPRRRHRCRGLPGPAFRRPSALRRGVLVPPDPGGHRARPLPGPAQRGPLVRPVDPCLSAAG